MELNGINKTEIIQDDFSKYIEKSSKYLSLTESLDYISNQYISKINNIIEKQNFSGKYDELMIYDASKIHDENIGSPFFLNSTRNDLEGFSYDQDSSRMINLLKKQLTDGSLILNKPILLENAPGTEIDIQAYMDINFILFLNKKTEDVSREEFELIKTELYSLIYSVKNLINNRLLEKIN